MKSENEKPKLNAWSCDWMDYYTEQSEQPELTELRKLELSLAGWLEVATTDFRRQGNCSSTILMILEDEIAKVRLGRAKAGVLFGSEV